MTSYPFSNLPLTELMTYIRVESLETKYSKVLIKMHRNVFYLHLKVLSAKSCLFHLRPIMLNHWGHDKHRIRFDLTKDTPYFSLMAKQCCVCLRYLEKKKHVIMTLYCWKGIRHSCRWCHCIVWALPYQNNSKPGFMVQSSDLMGDATWN